MHTLNRRTFLKLAGAKLAVLSTVGRTSVEASRTAERPNIILIMSDDMGYSDIACYGGEINTPNLDRLASNGLRFTQFYNTAKCSPTRASLLSGCYHREVGESRLGTGQDNEVGVARQGPAALHEDHLHVRLRHLDDKGQELADAAHDRAGSVAE